MLDNLRYVHGVKLVVGWTIYFTTMELIISWTSSRGVELMASNEGGEGKGTD